MADDTTAPSLPKKRLAQARRALRYWKEGIPIKDAFQHGYEEEELFVALLKFAVASADAKEPA